MTDFADSFQTANLITARKNFFERPVVFCFVFCAPYGKFYGFKRMGVFGQDFTGGSGDQFGRVSECAATECTENENVVTVCGCHRGDFVETAF